MTDDLIEAIRRDRESGTPGPWSGANMTHAEGRAMTPKEIGEYVTNSVELGTPNKFLFVTGKHGDGADCDICHTGNGPKGDFNTRRIARVPDMEARILSDAKALEAADRLADAVAEWGAKGRTTETAAALNSALVAYAAAREGKA